MQEDCHIQNVWLMGGLSILTSVPIMPQFVCLLCASKGQHDVRSSSHYITQYHLIITHSTSVITQYYSMSVVMSIFILCWRSLSLFNFEINCSLSQMIYCQMCCEPFHHFCLPADDRPKEENKENWCCRRCKFCHVCGRKSKQAKVLYTFKFSTIIE